MPITRTYQCPGCEGEFSFMHHPVSEPPPRFCPLCGYDTVPPEADANVPYLKFTRAITAPHVAKPVGKGVDGYVRAMEEGEQHRVNVAREMGLDKEDADQIKVGPMPNDMREGDTAVKEVNNTVTQAMAAQPGKFGFVGDPAMGQQYAAAAQSGPYPKAGAKALSTVQQFHSSNAPAMVQAGAKKG